ncbi:alpha/beta hydrolase [Microbacterium sp. HD4P20]|uniref:alpha/beta fold hydrolase n=1 Tax=Microbacterium sp. HD4P20 TaxID=2864874 RepID=UPI001C643D48|nr:alpha/beta hydrolase [Microbacterium sp. HD4P20]MCP2637302.1 alpha/beta hydrolase [Microbacterium sp. HD4P20]
MTTIDDALERDQAIPDLDWRVFPAGTERDVFAAPSGGLARVRLGDPDAPRVVLMPGVAGSKEDFVLLMPVLAAAGYRVESFDLAGHWESVDAGPAHLHPPRERYDYRLFVDDLVAILEDGMPAHVLGYSFAGLVTELALIERPELFRSLTLMSAPPATGQVFRGVKHIGPISDMSPHRAAGLILWGIRYNLNRTPPGRIAFVRERLPVTQRACIDDVVGLMMAMPDVAEDVAAIDIPKLIAVGEQDLWPQAQHDAYAARIGARVATYPTGHAPCETAPHQLARDMLRLFAEARRPRADEAAAE